MTPHQWIDLLEVLVWPLVVAAAVVLLRHPLGRFLEGLGERATKLSILKVELELGQAHPPPGVAKVGFRHTRSLDRRTASS